MKSQEKIIDINKKSNPSIDSEDDSEFSFSSSDSNSIEDKNQESLIEQQKEKQDLTEQEKISEKIVKKWVALQKIIKEEITLEEVIITKYKEDFEKIKKYYNDYYDSKLYFRTNFELMKNSKKTELNNINPTQNFLDREGVHQILVDTYEPIKNLLFTFRTNYDYLIKLVSLVDSTDDPEKVESLVELFCNQFYENILIPNPEQKELLLLIFLLFKNEIKSMNNASSELFLDNKTFFF